VCYNIIKSATDYDTAAFDCQEFFHKQTAREFLSSGYGCKMVCVSSRSSLLDVIHLITSMNIKRVGVLRDGCFEAKTSADLSFIVSESDILDFLRKNPHLVDAEITASQCMSKNHNTTDDEAEKIVRDKYLIASSFRAIWNKQISGGATTHGHSFLDKFTNWITHIITAELPLEDMFVSQDEPIMDLIKIFLEQNTDRVLVNGGDGMVCRQVQTVDLMRVLLEGNEMSLREL